MLKSSRGIVWSPGLNGSLVGLPKAAGVALQDWLGIGSVTQGELWSIFLALAATIVQVCMLRQDKMLTGLQIDSYDECVQGFPCSQADCNIALDSVR